MVISETGTLTIKAIAVSSTVNDIVLSVDGVDRRNFSVIRYQIQARQIEVQSNKWRPPSGSIDNLLSVWPGRDLSLKVHFTPEAFGQHMPEDFISWVVPNTFPDIPANTLEYTFKWESPGGAIRLAIELPKLHTRRIVMVDVPDIGSIGQYEASLIINATLLGISKVAKVAAYMIMAREWTDPMTDNQRRDAHAYWMALCASDPLVGSDVGLFIGKGHEVTDKDTAFEATIDLHNNCVGSSTVYTKLFIVPDYDAIKEDLLKKYDAGELWILDGTPPRLLDTNGQVIKSNNDKLFKAEEIMPSQDC